MSNHTQQSSHQSDLVYRLHDKPPFMQSLFAAIQHLLALFVAVITPPLIICQTLGIPAADTAHIISMSLFITGVASFIQMKRFGPVGTGLLSIQGTSFNFLGPIIASGLAMKDGGVTTEAMLAAIFGTALLAAPTEMIISRFLHLARRIISPLVSGIIVTLIGLTLIQLGLTSIGGGFSAMAAGEFGSLDNLALAGTVLGIIILMNRSRNPYVRLSSILVAMVAGTLLAWQMGKLAPLSESLPAVALPIPMQYGLGFDASLFIPLVLVYVITSLEAIGDTTATSEVSGEPVSGPVYMKRLKGCVLGDGVNSSLASIFNTFPVSTFSQNNGVIQMTGVASRHVGFFVAGILVIMGLFPAISTLVQRIPEPVLGGATLVMFGSIAAAGVRILSREKLDRRALFIIAISFGMGLGISQKPDILQFMPDIIKNVFASGISAGGITAIVMNIIMPMNKSEADEAAADAEAQQA
ncbi:nucleobase:cation symporter-2 family protein [Oceanimonas pelagia]|uniref:Nucleobase:cation symporter-2 family protein n=1 Tax=Oceanimonas pelagia TaxID=3028314 RepID=A0AA50KQ93_9GAMM|nr:nucleobase:cation symporter-2 family protein [Oceanimonas pelagia]WMC11090.1 nucleobase:cation symporter-2 family protein [Oceanimonas pelagia]